MRIGLTGGIGSGKSSVAKIFAACGAHVIDADASAREAVAPGTEGFAAVAARWPEVIGPAGEIDRAALGYIIFNDEAARGDLNEIVHPIVRRLGALHEKAASPGQLIVHVVPLLFETGFNRDCAKTVVVVSEEALRIARIHARDGMDETAIRARMRRQIEPAAARILATLTIENNGTFEELKAKSEAAFAQLSVS